MMARAEMFGSETTVKLQASNADTYFTRVALVSQPNTFSNVWATSDAPGQFTWVNAANATLAGNNPRNIEDEIQYPISLGEIGYTPGSSEPNPWDQVKWLYLDNNSLPEFNKTYYDISMTRENIGNLEPNTPFETRFAYPGEYYVTLDLSIQSKGWKFFFYDYGNILNPYYLYDAEGNVVSTISGSLPDYYPGEDPIRSYFSFLALDKGVYHLLFKPNAKFLSFELRTQSDVQPLDMGDRVVYRSQEFDQIDPSSLLGEIGGLPVQIYTFEVEAGQYLQYSLDYIWDPASGPTTRLVIPTPDGYSVWIPTSSGDLRYFLNEYSGDCYLIVIHDSYFDWDGGTPVQNLLSYSFTIDTVEPQEYSLDSTEILNIPSNSEFLALKFVANESMLVTFNSTILSGSPSYNLAASPSNAIKMLDEERGTIYMPVIRTIDGISAYELLPGTYYLEFYHSGSGQENEYVKIQSRILPYYHSVNHFEMWATEALADANDGYYTINDTQKSLVPFSEWDRNDPDGTTFNPVIFPFEYLDDIRFGLDISLLRDDNPEIENFTLRYRLTGGMFVRSKFDNMTLMSSNVISPTTITLDSADNETSSTTKDLLFGSAYLLSGNGTGLCWMWPTRVEINNGTDWMNYNNTLRFRVGTYDYSHLLKKMNIGDPEKLTIVNDGSLNYTTINYDYEGVVNDSRYMGLTLTYENVNLYDWWQFIIHTNLSGPSSLSCLLFFDNVWQNNLGPTNPNSLSLVTASTNADFFLEYGIAAERFSIIILYEDSLTDQIEISLKVSHLNATILMSPDTTSEFKTDFSKWVLPLSIGGGAAIIVIVGSVILYKKKHPI